MFFVRTIQIVVISLAFFFFAYGAPLFVHAESSPLCTNITSYLSARAPWNTDGATGGAVTRLQNYLITSKFLSGEATGFFGSLTQRAVQQLQATHGLVSSGTPDSTGYGGVGPGTRALLNRLSCSSELGKVTSLPQTQSGVAPVLDSRFATSVSFSEKIIGFDALNYEYVTELTFAGGSVAQPATRWTAHFFCPPGVSMTSTDGATCGEYFMIPPKTYNERLEFTKRFYVKNTSGVVATVPVTLFARNAGNTLIGTTHGELSIPTSTTTLSSRSEVLVVQPNTSVTFFAGDTMRVDWQASGGPYAIDKTNRVDISLVGDKTFLYSGLANDGTEVLSIPASVPGGMYKIRVAVLLKDGSRVFDESDSSFTIVEKPLTASLSLTSTRSGEVWKVGKRQIVQYKASNAPAGSLVYFVFTGSGGVSFAASTTPLSGTSLGTIGVEVPELVCVGVCSATSTMQSRFANPYTLDAVLYGPFEANGVRQLLARSAPVTITVAAADVSDTAQYKVVGTEIAGNLGASIISFDATYYVPSGSNKIASTTLEFVCAPTLITRVRYGTELTCGKVVPMSKVAVGSLYRLVVEASNTTAQKVPLTVVAKAYDEYGHLMAQTETTHFVRATGALASSPLTINQPVGGATYSTTDTVTVQWGAFAGDFSHYVLEVLNKGRDAVVVLAPYIEKTNTSMTVSAEEVLRMVGFVDTEGKMVQQGYYFRIRAEKYTGYIASGISGEFSIKPVVAQAKTGRNEAVFGLLSTLSTLLQSLQALLLESRQ